MKGEKQTYLLNCNNVIGTEVKTQSCVKEILSYLKNQECKYYCNGTLVFQSAEKKKKRQ